MQDANVENKLRLLMIYASVYPEKFEGDKALKLMQVAARSSCYFLFSMMDLCPTVLFHEFKWQDWRVGGIFFFISFFFW